MSIAESANTLVTGDVYLLESKPSARDCTGREVGLEKSGFLPVKNEEWANVPSVPGFPS